MKTPVFILAKKTAIYTNQGWKRSGVAAKKAAKAGNDAEVLQFATEGDASVFAVRNDLSGAVVRPLIFWNDK